VKLLLPLSWALSAALAACIFSPSYEGTRYRCPDGECPDGFECVKEICEPLGRDASSEDAPEQADAAADAPVDAVPGVDANSCELAAEQPHNDACAQAILLASVQTIHGDTRDHANLHNPGPTGSCTTTTTIGYDAVYEVAANPGQEITVTMTPDGWDGQVYLVDECSSFTSCLAGSEHLGAGIPEDFTHVATSGADGTDYFIVVDGATLPQSGCFTLAVEVQ